MDKRKIIDKILCSIDLGTKLQDKLFESQIDKEIPIIDNMIIRVQVECENNYFPEISEIFTPLFGALCEILEIQEDSFMADDVVNIACDNQMPIQERVERLLALNE